MSDKVAIITAGGGGVEALGEPAVNRREQIEGFRPPAPFTP